MESIATPVLGLLHGVQQEEITARQGEVQAIFLVRAYTTCSRNREIQAPLSELIASMRFTSFRYHNHYYKTPVFFSSGFLPVATDRSMAYDGSSDGTYKLWGLSAAILYETLCCLSGSNGLLSLQRP